MMISHNIEQIKQLLPEVEEVMIFYDDGLVYQSSFDQSATNIPQCGKELSNILTNIKNLYELVDFKIKGMPTLIFETEGMDMIITKIGERTNLVLFFREIIEDPTLKMEKLASPSVKKQFRALRRLLDIGCIELAQQELNNKIQELGRQYMDLVRLKLRKQKELDVLDDFYERKKISNKIEEIKKDIKEKRKELEQLKQDVGKSNSCTDEE